MNRRVQIQKWLRGGRRAAAGVLLSIAVLLLSSHGGGVHGQIVLDGPNLTGTVGLNGQTFGSADVYFSWPGGSVVTRLVNGDRDYSVRVEPNKVLSASVNMYSFQGSTSANVYHSFSNITGPLSTATSPMVLGLSREAGRIIGRVAVVGGSVARVSISAYRQVSSNEYQQGNATATSAPFDALLPFGAVAGVSVQGSAVLRASSGCEVPVTLGSKTVDVISDADAIAAWSFDLTSETCNQGSIQGQVVMNGLIGVNADAIVQQRYVSASGPVGRSVTTDAAGSYVFSSLPPGTYYVSNTNYFNAPYGYLGTPSSATAVAAGALVTRDFVHNVGTAHLALRPKGAWSLADVQDLWTYWNVFDAGGTHVGYSGDSASRPSGIVDIVSPGGSARLEYYRAYFYKNDGARYMWEYFYDYFYNGGYPVQAAVTTGGRHDLGVYEPETSEAEIVIQLANANVGLSSLRLTGYHNVRDASNRQIGYRWIDLNDQAQTTPQNSTKVLVRGRPGTYQMTAIGQGTDGATYSKNFELVLGVPQNTPEGTGVVMPITIGDGTGTTTGSITFGNVITTGETTISASESGPNPRNGFAVVGSGVRMYFDIRTTATFDAAAGATLCLTYDDAGMTANQESRLTLEHYVCSAGNSSCGWENITSAGYPDTSTNTICGVTSSFSIFALMRPLDGDGDGVTDAEDNCPAVQNADQADFDGDGIGDQCDSDLDGDGVEDTVDTCPTVASPNQTDTDGDGLGDICDPDVDGDGFANGDDNCPVNANANQTDFDGDGIGDACDPDDDNDGVSDGTDACAGTAAGALIEVTGCSSPQSQQLACPTNATYRNHGHYVQCVAHEAERQVLAGLIAVSEKDAIIATAAKSEVGKQ